MDKAVSEEEPKLAALASREGGLDTQVVDYEAQDIQVLKGLEGVRVRPGMYIGDTTERGLHHLVYEVVDNSIDEALAGYCTLVDVAIHLDGSVSGEDDGRGIPTGMHPKEGIPTPEVVLTKLHAGGKFSNDSYKVSGGLHGVGVSVVNALSEWLELKIRREGKEYFIRFKDGDAEAPLEISGDAPKGEDGEPLSGTEITFLASTKTFTNTEYDFATLEHRLRELAFLNSGVGLTVTDARSVDANVINLNYEGGLSAFVEYLDRAKTALLQPPIFIDGQRDDVNVQLALQWNDSYHETMLCFTNNIPQRDGGSHMAGFRGALTRTINSYASSVGIAKKDKVAITGDDA